MTERCRKNSPGHSALIGFKFFQALARILFQAVLETFVIQAMNILGFIQRRQIVVIRTKRKFDAAAIEQTQIVKEMKIKFD